MGEGRFGHFGVPGAVLAGAALAAFVLHLAVPYAHVDPRDGADGEGESFTLDRAEAADVHRDLDLVGASSPGLTLTGTILMLIAGLGLVALSFAPLTVTPGRWLGWGLAAVAALGGLLAFISSLLWVGSGFGQAPFSLYGDEAGGDFGRLIGLAGDEMVLGFGGVTGGLTGALEALQHTDNAADVVILSPLLVAAAAATVLLASLRIASNVVSLENGYRERADEHLSGARWALVLLTLVAVVPWSIGKIEDYEGQGDTDFFHFGAHTVLNAEATSDGELYDGLAYSIRILMVLGWAGFALSFLGSMGGVLASVGAPPALARSAHFTLFGTAFLLLWGGILYVLAWTHQWRPEAGADDFQPGYFPAVLVPILTLWSLRLVRVLRVVLAARAGHLRPRRPDPVRFD